MDQPTGEYFGGQKQSSVIFFNECPKVIDRFRYSLYAPEATVQTSTKMGSLKWEIFSREEWFSIIQRRFQESYVGSGLEFKFFKPKSIAIEGDEARVTIPYELSSFEINYSETGFFNFELKKESFGWTITKFRYEILTSNHQEWGEYQLWLKNRK